MTEVGLFRRFTNREGLAFVAEHDFLLPIVTAAIAVLRHSWFMLLFRGFGCRPSIFTRTYGVAVTLMGSLYGFANRDRVLTLVAEGDLLLIFVTPGFLLVFDLAIA